MPNNVLNIKETEEFLRIMKHRFLEKIGNERYFRLVSTPIKHQYIDIDVQQPDIIDLLRKPPNYRNAGWNISVMGEFLPILEGIENQDYSWRHLLLLKNAHLEFWAKIDDSFCWRQNDIDMKQHPRLYPYAIIEYTFNFFRLLKSLLKIIGLTGNLFIGGGLYNCSGCYIRPGHPDNLEFQDPQLYKSNYWESNNPIELRNCEIIYDFDVDEKTYHVVTEIYAAFGIERKYVPLFDNKNKIIIPK